MANAQSRWHLPTLLLILTVGAVLRFTALGQGIPYALGIDEPEIMERAVRMMKTGDLHPYFFDYPGLYIYLQFLVACVRFVVGSIGGLWSNLSEAPTAEFYLWGRTVTAAFGAATVLLVYLAGRRISALTGLMAAALFAVQSLHVRESHFVLTDVPMTFFVALTWVLSLRAAESRDTRGFLWVGLAVGAAAATKYNGGVAFLLPLLALALGTEPWRWRVRALLLSVLGAAGMFLLCAPYTVLALPEFLNAFAYLADMYADGPPRPEAAWLTYYKHLRNNVSIPALIAAGGGLLLALRALWRAPRAADTRVWVLTTAFALVYYYMISGQRLVWGRYLLPLLPFLCVLAGGAVAWLVTAITHRARQRQWPRPLGIGLASAITLLLVLGYTPTTNALNWLSLVSKVSTNKQAYDWIVANIPAGSRIATETREVLLPDGRYDMDFQRRLIDQSTDHYLQGGYDYIFASSLSFRVAFYQDPPEEAALIGYRDLFRRTEHVITFMPSETHPGPELRIHRVPRPE